MGIFRGIKMNSIVKFKTLLKSLVFPITLLTIISFLSILISIHALYVAFTKDPIYAFLVIPITIFLIILYILDRFLIKKVAYSKLMLGELIIGIFVFLLFSYQESYTDINFNTNQDYILVIFDAKEKSISNFKRKGIFGKLLNVDTNKIHLDSSMALRKNLRINDPAAWRGSYYKRGKYDFKGDSIEYIISLQQDLSKRFIKKPDVYIDSLLQEEMK